MAPVMGDGNGEGDTKGCSCFQRGRGGRRGGSIVPDAEDTAESGAAAGEPEGGSWRLDVEDDQRKLCQ
jgi:hypothetical protein